MPELSFVSSVIIPVGAALLGAVAGGVIPAQLQHAREQRYAARALLSWMRSSGQQLSALLVAMSDKPEDQAFTYWTQHTLAPMNPSERAHLLRSLPEWLDNVILMANVRLEQLNIALEHAARFGAREHHGILYEAGEGCVEDFQRAEQALTFFLDNHSEAYGDRFTPIPERWRADQRRRGREI